MEREKRIKDVDLDTIRAEMRESEEIDRRVEVLMAPEEDGGNGKKKKKRKKNKGENGYSEKQGLIKRIEERSCRRKIIAAAVTVIAVVLISSRFRGSSKNTGTMVGAPPLSK